MSMTKLTIAATVADAFGVHLHDLTGPSRLRHYTAPRQAAYAICTRLMKESAAKVGWFFGQRDHTTVLHGIKAHNDRLKCDADYARAVAEAERNLAPALFIRRKQPVFKSTRGQA